MLTLHQEKPLRTIQDSARFIFSLMTIRILYPCVSMQLVRNAWLPLRTKMGGVQYADNHFFFLLIFSCTTAIRYATILRIKSSGMG